MMPLAGDRLGVKALLGRATVVLGLLVVWQVTVDLGVVSRTYVSTPLDVLAALVDLAGDTDARSAFKETVWALGTAFVLGTGAGMVVGLALGLSNLLRKAYMGPVLFILATPKSIFLPILILLMGISWFSSAVFGAISAFFYVVVSVVGGVGLVEPRHQRVAQAFGANQWHRLIDVVVPSALPGIFAALWQGVNHAFSGVMLAELFASRGGIGHLIRIYANSFQADYLIAVVTVVSVAAIIAASLWGRLEIRMTRWRQTRIGSTTEVSI